MKEITKYKGITYRVMRSSFGTVNTVYVFVNGLPYDFKTIKQAKRFIQEVTV